MPRSKRTDSRLWLGEQPAQHCTGTEHRRTYHWLADGEPWKSCQVTVKTGPRKGERCGAEMVEVIAPRNDHIKVAPSRRAAAATVAKARAEVELGTYVGPSAGRISVGEALTAWLERQSTRVSENTYITEEIVVRRHLMPALGDAPLRDVSRTRIERLFTEMFRSAGDRRTETMRKCRRILFAIFARAVEDGEIVRNPVEGAEMPGKRRRSEGITAWTPEQVVAFLKYEANDPCRVVYMTAAYTGLRDSELCGLKRANVMLQGDRPHVDHDGGDTPHVDVRQTRVRHGNVTVEGAPKSERGTRTIPIGATLERELRAYRASQPVTQLDGYLFSDELGEPLHPDLLSKWFARAVLGFIDVVPEVDGLKVPRIGLHGLRHTFATTLFNKKVDSLVVSRLMGHSSAAFTLDVYGHLTRSAAHDAAEALEAALGG